MRDDTRSRHQSRREFLKKTAAISCAVGAVRAADGLDPDTAAAVLPKIKLGGLAVSRLILGCNPFFGFHHDNPQATDTEMKEYYTDERVMQVMDRAAERGITAVWSPPYDIWNRWWKEYRRRGGKLKIWIGQPDYGDMKLNIARCAENGAAAICIQGDRAGSAIREGKFALVREWLEQIKGFGLPAGLASHHPEDIIKAEELGLPAEWYHLTIGVPDSFEQSDRDKALETIRKIDKPVVAFKVLGAGRFMPNDAFPYVLGKLRRKDGMCVGVFPKRRDEIAEISSLTLRLTR